MASKISDFLLFITGDCNAKCEFCYQDRSVLKGLKMSSEVRDRIVKVAFKQDTNKTGFSFFGGEPFIREDFIIESLEYINNLYNDSNKNYQILIFTNGLFVSDAFMEYLKEFIKNKNLKQIRIQVSYEGESNTLRDGDSLSNRDKIESNIVKLTTLRDTYDKLNKLYILIRSTFSNETIHNSETLYDIFQFAVNARVQSLSIEPVIESNWDDSKLDLFTDSLNRIYPELLDIYKEDKRINFVFHPVTPIAFQGRGITRCGAGDDYIAVSCNGDFYPCQRTSPGSDCHSAEDKMGNIFDVKDDGVILQNLKYQCYDQPLECDDCPVMDCEFCPAINLKEKGVLSTIVNENRCNIKRLFYKYQDKLKEDLLTIGIDLNVDNMEISGLVLVYEMLCKHFNIAPKSYVLTEEHKEISFYTVSNDIFELISLRVKLPFLPIDIDETNTTQYNFNQILFYVEVAFIILLNVTLKLNLEPLQDVDGIRRLTKIVEFLPLLNIKEEENGK